MKEIQQKDIKLLRFSDDIIKAAEEQTKTVLDLYAKNDEVFKEVYDEWLSFKEKIREWSNLNKI